VIVPAAYEEWVSSIGGVSGVLANADRALASAIG
jgi:hypothetical protein